jgi:hypothetical protein
MPEAASGGHFTAQIAGLLKTKEIRIQSLGERFLGTKKKCSPRRMSIPSPPVQSGVMFDGRIIFDGIATVKKLW